MTTATKNMSVVISAKILSSLLCTASFMFLNYTRFASDRIAMFHIYQPTLTPTPEKSPSRNIIPHSPWNGIGLKQHWFQVPRPRRIIMSKRVIYGTNNPPLRHCKPRPRPIYRRQEKLPGWWSRTGQLRLLWTQWFTIKQRDKKTSAVNSIPNTFSHSKPGVQHPSPVPSNRSTPTFSQPFHNYFLPDGLTTNKGGTLEMYQ